ncbi:MAG: GTP-binding protein [Alteromonas naphthalenivorans]
MTKRVRSNLRNIAIIAHVDHGKTTLVDKLLQQSGTLDEEKTTDRVMDSNDIERERGITILAKNTGINYKDYQINIVDTPGHADFGGEVERTLQMVEGFLLLVDAAEGVLPGTRFVLQKALALNLKPIVLINKIDRQDAQIEETESLINDLFLDLALSDDQLDFPVLYGSSKLGFAKAKMTDESDSMDPLFQAIIDTVPAPVEQTTEGLQILVTNIDHSDFLGTIAVGRVLSGTLKLGGQFVYCYDDVVSRPMKVTKLYKFHGISKYETESVEFGDIVALAGCDEIEIGSTLCSPDKPLPCEYVAIDEPTLSVYLSVNDSPFNGQEGKLLSSRVIKDRLEKELKINVALRVEPTDTPSSFKVSGRGQLHLGILIENMRREGFELQVSAPEVIYKTIDGKKHEPIEFVTIDVNEEYQGSVIQHLGTRKGEMTNLVQLGSGRVRMEFTVPARGLLGFRGQFLTNTRGTGIMNSTFHGYEPYKGDIPTRIKGALASMERGKTTAYALDALQARGDMFIGSEVEVYEGMIVGEHSRDNCLDVNPCKGKKLTNMRASGSDESVKIKNPRLMTLEMCMEWIRPDELIEVTPTAIRLRKKVLKAGARKKK